MKTATRNAHAHRIDAVVTRLQRALEHGGPLPDLAGLAAVAHLSPFHFHRVWRALTGETLGRTIARLRLLRALELLGDPRIAIGDVAARVGYETPQAFARALRDALDASPGDLRGQPGRLAAAADGLAMPARAAADAAPLQVEVVSLAPFEVVALRNRGAFDDLDVAFGRLFGWAAEAGVADAIGGLFGVPLGDHRELGDALEFDCAIRLSGPATPPAPLRTMRLGGGGYARVRRVGAYAGLEDLLDRVLAEWWPGSGHGLRDAPVHYEFLDDPDVVPEALLRADLYLPLQAADGD